MPQLNHTGPENEGPKTGRKLGKCKKTEEEQSLIGALGVGQGKRLNAGGGTGKGKRLQYNKKKINKGSLTYKLHYLSEMKKCLLLIVCMSAFAFKSYGGIIEGSVKYANGDSTHIRAAKVILWDNLWLKLDSVNADQNGTFFFSNLSDGVYHLTVKPYHPWGGVNSTDAMITLKHFVGMLHLDSLQRIAADVSNNHVINSTDALLIAKRFTGLVASFPSGDWASTIITIPLTESDTATVMINILCTGDVNNSYIPDNQQFLICGDTLTDTRDGRKYSTVLVGNQCWFRQNLNIGTFINGTDNQSNNGLIEKYCYNNDTVLCAQYGGLYQWTEMMLYTSVSGAQGICPAGFHIPNDGEWSSLVSMLGPDSIAGGNMKEMGYAYWNFPNTGATNESGFSIRGSGNRIGSGAFLNIQSEAKIWSSTQQNSNSAWYRNLYYNSSLIEPNNHGKNNGLSVRCLKVY